MFACRVAVRAARCARRAERAGGARTVSEDWIRADRGMLFIPSSESGAHSEQVFAFENVSRRAGVTVIAAREGGRFSCLVFGGIRWYSERYSLVIFTTVTEASRSRAVSRLAPVEQNSRAAGRRGVVRGGPARRRCGGDCRLPAEGVRNTRLATVLCVRGLWQARTAVCGCCHDYEELRLRASPTPTWGRARWVAPFWSCSWCRRSGRWSRRASAARHVSAWRGGRWRAAPADRCAMGGPRDHFFALLRSNRVHSSRFGR